MLTGAFGSSSSITTFSFCLSLLVVPSCCNVTPSFVNFCNSSLAAFLSGSSKVNSPNILDLKFNILLFQS